MDTSPVAGKGSEIARLRAQIAREHEAACFGLYGLNVGTAQHWFISRRMERISEHQRELAKLVGERASMELVCEIFENSPEQQSLSGGGS